MPSILTCAIITLYEHQPVSTVCACMARQRSWNHFTSKLAHFSSGQPVIIIRLRVLLSRYVNV